MKLTLPDGTAYSKNPPTMQRHFKVPLSGTFVQLKHDYETAEANPLHPYKPRSFDMATEVPETVHLNPFEYDDFVALTPELEEFMLATLRIPNPVLTREQAIDVWREITRTSVCWTDNGNSWDRGRRSVLLGTPGDRPMGWKMLGFGGNIHKVIYGRVIEAIDYTKPLPNPAELYKAKPYLFEWSTQCYAIKLADGTYKVSRFPQMRPVNVLTPVLGFGGMNRIAESWRIKPIANGVTYSPYVF